MRTLLVLFALLVTPNLWANDAEYGSYGGSPAPVKNHDISMVSEDIVIAQRADGGWDVTADYVFANTSKQPVKLTMGFPEMAGDNPDEFLEFKTTVREQPVKVRVEKSAPFLKLNARALGRVHLFDLEFASEETVAVSHRYRMNGGGSVALAIEKTVQYVTRTGALWKGPIGRATFTIRTRDVYELLAWSPEFKFKSLKRFVIQKGVTTGMELVLENTDWTPKGDLQLDMMTDIGDLQKKAVGQQCPELEVTDWRAMNDAPLREKTQYLKMGDLSAFDVETLRLCRNWIYARYGYTFKSAALNKRFYGKVGVGNYPPGMEHVEDFKPSRRMLAPLMPDPSFSTDMFTVQDLFYMRALVDEEKRRKSSP